MGQDTADRTGRVLWIDILKGIGLIAVIFGHIYRNVPVLQWLYTFHVPLFFFAGGLLYKEREIKADLRRRFQTIVIPYFTLGGLVLLYWILIERHFRELALTPLQAAGGFLYGSFDKLEFHSHLWFLPCYFVTMVFYNILRKSLGRRAVSVIALLFGAAYAFGPDLGYALPELPWGADRVLRYLPFVELGSILNESGLVRRMQEQNPLLCAGEGFAAAALGWLLTRYFTTGGPMFFVDGFLGVTGFSLLSIAACRVRAAEIIAYVSRISMVTLCFHGPIYRVIVKAFAAALHTDTEAIRGSFLLCAVIVVLTTACCGLLDACIARAAPWAAGRKRAAGSPAVRN